MPHLLVAGTTGSQIGGINTMILSLLYRLTRPMPLILVDPKMLELSVYDGIPHLLAPVVTEPKAVVALKWVVQENGTVSQNGENRCA